jgi:hypothetical protein
VAEAFAPDVADGVGGAKQTERADFEVLEVGTRPLRPELLVAAVVGRQERAERP